MKSDFDTKLRDIVWEYEKGRLAYMEFVSQIKQPFIRDEVIEKIIKEGITFDDEYYKIGEGKWEQRAKL